MRNLAYNIAALEEEHERQVRERDHWLKIKEKEEADIAKSSKRQRNLKRAVKVLDYLIARNYGNVVELFEDTVTAGLQDLFNNGYEFILEVERSGENATCELQVATDKCDYFQDLRMTQGKALQEIVACLVRIIICHLDNSMPNMCLIDEPFGGCRDFRRQEAGMFLKKIGEHFGIQVIIVTQDQDMVLCADNVIDLNKRKARVKC